MKQAVVECIANYSEARRPEVIDEITDSIQSIEGVVLLDQHSDDDHNRTVLTFAGNPDAVEEAAFRSIACATRLIDLENHQGEHPRIGAADVVPFVPISGINMKECVEIAERVGQRVADEIGIPVFLYEEAARKPERRNLENIRRGEFEKLKQEIETNPDRKPDFGPDSLGSAGAVVIGARQPLIAFNVNLTTQDIKIAKKIARHVRHSSGGLRYVKALGMLVDDRAQVSMNLTNFRKTSIHTVVELIRREAQRYGTGVHSSELVGLIPAEALVESSRWYLQLDLFDDDQILENRLASAGSNSENDPDDNTADNIFIEALASSDPTPGGGAAAAYSGVVAAALVQMVARLTIGKKKYAEVQNSMKRIEVRTEILRSELNALISEDVAAFDSVMSAYKMAGETDDQKRDRSIQIQAALRVAAEVPLEGAQKSLELLSLSLETVQNGNINAISDGASAAEIAYAALRACLYNVRINVASLDDQKDTEELMKHVSELEIKAENVLNEVRTNFLQRGGLAAE